MGLASKLMIALMSLSAASIDGLLSLTVLPERYFLLRGLDLWGPFDEARRVF